MPFNPNLPATGSEILSAELRAQFNALHDLIPASAVVDSVEVLPNGSGGSPQASATASLSGGVLHFTFGISAGPPGPPGEVTTAQLNDATAQAVTQATNIMLSSSSANTNGVATFDDPAPATYDAMVIQSLINKLNELIMGLRR